ncbi:hypothetical protein [Streptomyces filamentosus]|uniref:hypothetical protein n=1 Tax=Streptomyces filamentosus TaxID=67294 RepID=UPI0033F738BE
MKNRPRISLRPAKPASAAGPVEPETSSTARVRDTIRLREGHTIPPEWTASSDGN